MEQAIEILIPNGDYDEDRLADALGLQPSILIEQRSQLGLAARVGEGGVVVLAPDHVSAIMVALGLAEKTPRGLRAVADVDLAVVIAQARHEAVSKEPAPKSGVVCGFPINEYLVQIRWPDEKPGGKKRFARIQPSARRRLRHGKSISVYPPVKGDRWETKKPRRRQ